MGWEFGASIFVFGEGLGFAGVRGVMGKHFSAAAPFFASIASINHSRQTKLERVMKIGFIGLGKMGSGIAANLLKAGHEVTVFNRTPGKAEPLAAMIFRACVS